PAGVSVPAAAGQQETWFVLRDSWPTTRGRSRPASYPEVLAEEWPQLLTVELSHQPAAVGKGFERRRGYPGIRGGKRPGPRERFLRKIDSSQCLEQFFIGRRAARQSLDRVEIFQNFRRRCDLGKGPDAGQLGAAVLFVKAKINYPSHEDHCSKGR